MNKIENWFFNTQKKSKRGLKCPSFVKSKMFLENWVIKRIFNYIYICKLFLLNKRRSIIIIYDIYCR